MIAHVISDFSRPQGFGDRFWAMLEAICTKLEQLMTLPPESLPQ